MKPEYVNSLKAGVKTAIITFITSMVLVLASLMNLAMEWADTGRIPDLSIARGTAVAAGLALVIGIGNTVLRFIQAAAVPFVGALLDKVLGVIPDYLPPPAAPVDNLVEADPGLNDPAVPLHDDAGETTIITVVAVLAGLALLIWILRVV